MVLLLVHVDNMAGGDAHTRGNNTKERREASHGALRVRQVQEAQQGGSCSNPGVEGEATPTDECRHARCTSFNLFYVDER